MSTPRRKWVVGKDARRMCTAKVRHPDEIVARIIGEELIAGGFTTSPRLFTYRCTLCRGWHLTKKAQCLAIARGDLFQERRP